jgi:penicillin-binding protein 2
MKTLESRKEIVIGAIVIVALLLISRAAQLQLFSDEYKERAERTTLDRSIIYPSRGLIYDRNGKIMVYNKPIYIVEATYNKIDPKMDTALFCSLLQIDRETFVANLTKDWKSGKFNKSLPFTFMSKISPEQFAIFQEHLYKFPGFTTGQRIIRGYPHTNGSHVLGYLGEVDQRIIDRSQGLYTLGDYIGLTGLEVAYESELSGGKGVNYILKDNLGRRVGAYENGSLDSMAVPGEDVYISIDLDLQAYADSLMMNKRGGIVAIEPSTGEILAMVSAPTYDPNILNLDGNRGQGMSSLLMDTINRPLNNRAVTNRYPPGSIFKPILSLVALQMQATTPSRGTFCPGYYRLSASKVQKCTHAHGTIHNMSEAIQHSCNVYYYQLMRDVLDKYSYKDPGIGLDTLVSHLRDFGMGRKLGLDYSYENKGLMPNSEYFDRIYKRETGGWRSAWVLSLGIGQGEMQLTTVQMANLATILANRGWYYTPHLVKKFVSGKPIKPEYRTKNYVRIDPKHFPPVIEGMAAVVTAGTARVAAIDGIEVCGKTGTSQNPHGEDHSVFFGFAPKNNPQIAIAVFVENAGFGNTWAAPISSLLMERYLTKKTSPTRKYLQDRMYNGVLIDKPRTVAQTQTAPKPTKSTIDP